MVLTAAVCENERLVGLAHNRVQWRTFLTADLKGSTLAVSVL
jgi:hypothetical protein